VDHVMRMEQAVLGTVMEHPEFIDLFLERLPTESFSCTGTKVIAKAIVYCASEGQPFNNTAVLEQLRLHNTLSLGANMLTDCWEQGRFVSDPEQTINALGNLFALDEARDMSNRLYHGAANMDLTSWLTLAEEGVSRLRQIEAGTQPLQPVYLQDVLTGEDLTVEWCVPSLQPAGTATMLTAEEGVGKSTVLRQIAVSAMAGMHPFMPWTTKYAPQRTLLIDCEVSANQFKRSLRALWSYGREFQPLADTTMLAVETHQGGLNLSASHDQGWLHRLVRQHKATLVVVGPVYRFTDEDLNTEEGVRTWQRCFEPMLADGVAVITEHHAPNAPPGIRRALRPIGSSAMRRWFAQGIALRLSECQRHEEKFCPSCPRSASVESWRGSREEEARWPRYLKGEQGQVWWTSDEAREVSVN
jgi:hypothetical protein